MCDDRTSNGYDHNLVRDDRAANIRRVPSGDTVTSPSGPAPVVRRSADSQACVEGSTVTRQRLRTCSESPSKNRYRPERAQAKWPSESRSSVSCRSRPGLRLDVTGGPTSIGTVTNVHAAPLRRPQIDTPPPSGFHSVSTTWNSRRRSGRRSRGVPPSAPTRYTRVDPPRCPELVNRTRDPSGDHFGRYPKSAMRRSGSPRSEATYRPPPARSDRNTIRWPSGDQSGCESSNGDGETRNAWGSEIFCIQMSE